MSNHAKRKHSTKKNSYIDKKLFIFFIIVIIFCVILGVVFLVISWYNSETAERSQPEIVSVITNKPQGYNFERLKRTYPDIIGWIDVPNTSIAMPIVQHPNLDYFYLNHNAKQESDFRGAAYIEKKNESNLEDPVTVIYGHNMLDNTMFSTEHYFENPQFFNDNDKLYVYKPGHKLTYKVISAFVYDDRHILNSFDFSNKQVLLDYFASLKNPNSLIKNVRSDVELDENSKVIQLSTCMSDLSLTNQRYLLNGVLINDEETT